VSYQLLIVDDDPVVQHILSSILESLGHQTESLMSGVDCLTRLSEGENLPDALFLDMFLGDTTGIEVLNKLTAADCAKNLPVIMLTANSPSEMSDYEAESLPEYFLSKPFTKDEVSALLEKVFT
jgi:CheY-like chemotaxis protein